MLFIYPSTHLPSSLSLFKHTSDIEGKFLTKHWECWESNLVGNPNGASVLAFQCSPRCLLHNGAKDAEALLGGAMHCCIYIQEGQPGKRVVTPYMLQQVSQWHPMVVTLHAQQRPLGQVSQVDGHYQSGKENVPSSKKSVTNLELMLSSWALSWHMIISRLRVGGNWKG